MDRTIQINEQLDALASRLSARVDAILEAWRRAAEADPRLASVSSISRSQFYDHIPAVLAAFAAALRAQGGAERASAAAQQRQTAGEHGLVRWQQGFGLFEVMCEWRHLHLCLLDEFERDAANSPGLDAAAMLFARRALAELCGDGVCESAEQFSRLQQAEAAGRVEGLEDALARLSELERARAEIWREATHDLRGNLGVVKNAAAVLNFPGVPAPARDQSLTVLQRSVNALHALLNDLTSLARLEAGQEQRQLQVLDAGELLQQLGTDFQDLAAERGLFLSAAGPASLMVEGDAVKIRRIAQNLLLNALLYTRQGGVKLLWETDAAGRWTLCVQDTGPGFQPGRGTPLAEVLKHATDEAHDLGQQAPPADAPAEMPRSLASQSAPAPPNASRAAGEGIGLSIVKRLCELLDASIELQSEPGKGSTFRISLPRSYGTELFVPDAA